MEQIGQDTDRDNFMSGEEAVEYGLIDTVLEQRTDAAPSAEGQS
jgi:ATP-dependent Clp protease protease subunit